MDKDDRDLAPLIGPARLEPARSCPGSSSRGSRAVVRSGLIATAGESPAALSEVTISTTPAAQEQRVTVIIKMSFGVSLCLGSRLITAFTLTKRDNRSSGMVRSADSAIEAMIHGQARGKATTVPEVGTWSSVAMTDRKERW